MRRAFRLRQARPRIALMLVDGPTCPGDDSAAALRELDGEPLAARAVRQLEARGVERVVAITGCEAGAVLEAILRAGGGQISRVTLPNPHWRSGSALQVLAHASRRWSEPLLVVDGSFAWTEEDYDRLLLCQRSIAAGVVGSEQRIGMALFRDGAADWFGESCRTAARIGPVDRSWQWLLLGSRGGLPMDTVHLDGGLDLRVQRSLRTC